MKRLERAISVQILQPQYGGLFTTDGGGSLAFVLPGEVVAEGEPLRILEPAAGRVTPGCVHFGECGGCQYQHAEYGVQLVLEFEILKNIFVEAGLEGMPEASVHRGPAWGYRNRIRLRLKGSAEGVRVGYSRRGSNEFLPIRMCPIAAPLLWRAAEGLMGLAAEPVLRRWLSAVAEVELFSTADEARLQVLFLMHEAEIARREPAVLALLCEGLRERVPELRGAGAMLHPELNRRTRRAARWDGASWGADGLSYEAAGRSYWVGRAAFFQVNRFLVDELVELVCRGAGGELAWDLFAGVGLFTRALVERFDRVVAVEGGVVAGASLAIAARGGKGERGFEAVHASTLEFLRAREHHRERPGLVVLDPPRAGLGVEATEVLGRIGAARVVYVSCDPTTLARDLVVLLRAGYEAESVDLVDLFPQTFHLETVVRLQRKA